MQIRFKAFRIIPHNCKKHTKSKMVIIPIIEKRARHPIESISKTNGEVAIIFPSVPTAIMKAERVANSLGRNHFVKSFKEPLKLQYILIPSRILPRINPFMASLLAKTMTPIPPMTEKVVIIVPAPNLSSKSPTET